MSWFANYTICPGLLAPRQKNQPVCRVTFKSGKMCARKSGNRFFKRLGNGARPEGWFLDGEVASRNRDRHPGEGIEPLLNVEVRRWKVCGSLRGFYHHRRRALGSAGSRRGATMDRRGLGAKRSVFLLWPGPRPLAGLCPIRGGFHVYWSGPASRPGGGWLVQYQRFVRLP